MTQNTVNDSTMQTTKAMHISNNMLTTQINGSANHKLERMTVDKSWFSGSIASKCINKDQREEGKTRFSEKLKILLENGGGIVEKIDDPYAFQEGEQYLDISRTAALNNVCTVNKQSSSVQTTTPNGLYYNDQKAIFTPTVVSPVSSKFQIKPSDILPRHPAEAAKVKVPLLKPQKVPQSSVVARPLANPIAKNVQHMKNNGARSQGSGKPQNFGKSQMSKLAIAKIEKAIESKNSRAERGKGNSSNSTYKTASLNKLISNSKPSSKRCAPVRSASLDSDMSPRSDGKGKGKLTSSKSLLEESLLGLKQTELDKPWIGQSSLGVKQAMAVQAEPAAPPAAAVVATAVAPAPAPETASTTVFIPTHSNLKHESLQRIWNLRNQMKLIKRNYQQFGLLLGEVEDESHEGESDVRIFQNYWFSLCNDYDSFAGHTSKREAKLAQLKTELRHKLKQQMWRHREDYRDRMAKMLIKTAHRQPNLASFLVRLESSPHRIRRKANRPIVTYECKYGESGATGPCGAAALPGAPFCPRHILNHPSQMIFSPCSVIVPPSVVPCGAPAIGKGLGPTYCGRHTKVMFSVGRPVPLMADRALIKSSSEPVKRVRSSVSSSRSGRSGRSRKRKRQLTKEKIDPRDVAAAAAAAAAAASSMRVRSPIRPAEVHNVFGEATFVVSKSDVDETQDVEVGEEVLAIASASAELPLDSVELATLATQATRLLEEHDFTNVLNHIPADAFNDLFTEDKEEYEPTLQETEELERALEAVNNDVKSLEKLSETQGLLDMLDEQSIAQTLAALPEVVPVLYQNGFAGIGPIEQTLCDSHTLPNTLLIPTHADVLQS